MHGLQLHRAQQFGFTLIELLIVMVIISVVAAGVTLSIGHNRTWQQKMFVEEVAEKLSLAQEYAILQPANLQVTIAANHIQFKEWRVDEKTQQGRFVQVKDPYLQALPIPDEYIVRLQVVTAQSSVSADDDTETEKKPAIYISMNGDWTPFDISISRLNDARYDHVHGVLGGDLSIKVESDAT